MLPMFQRRQRAVRTADHNETDANWHQPTHAQLPAVLSALESIKSIGGTTCVTVNVPVLHSNRVAIQLMLVSFYVLEKLFCSVSY